MKMTNDLIKQYAEKDKEIQSLKQDLEVTKIEAMHMMSNSKSDVDKIAKLKNNLMNIEEENKKLKSKVDEYEISIAAYKQTIQQLKCKIEEMEDEHGCKTMEYNLQKSGFEEKIKSLECDLKKFKLIPKKKEKKITSINSDATKFSTAETKSTADVGINVSLCDSVLNTKSEVQDKSIMTDKFYNTKDDPYPLFCAKCEAHLSPTITPEKICRTMSTYPELINENIFSPPKKILPSCLSLDEYSDSTNKCEDTFSFGVLPTSLLNPCNNQYSDPMENHLKPQLKHSSRTTQSSENELKSSNIAMHVPVATNISTNYSSAKFTLPENIDCMKKYYSDLLAQHSSSFKQIQRKLKLLGSKMKKLRRSQKKQRTSSCRHHCVSNHDNGAFLNSNLLSTICKGVAQYYDEKRENERKIESENYSAEKIQLRKRKRSDDEYNEYNVRYNVKNPFSLQCENLEKDTPIEDTSNILEEVAEETDTLQSSQILCINKSTPTLDVNASNVSFNSTDQSYEKALVAHREIVSDSAEEVSPEDSDRKSHSSNDEICTSNNLLSESNVESVNESVMEMTCLSSDDDNKNCDEHSIDHAYSKIHTIADESKMKGKNQNKEKLNSRLLKNIRNLKRKTQTSHINKQENIESGPNHRSELNELAKRLQVENKNKPDNRTIQIKNLKRNLGTRAISFINMQKDSIKESAIELYSEPSKKLRIAHVPKTSSVPQLSVNQHTDYTHHRIKNIVNSEVSRQKYGRIQQLGTPTQKLTLLIKNEKDYEINKNCDEKNSVECIKARSIDQKPTSEKCQDNFALPITNNEYAPTTSEFNKGDEVSIEDGTDENVSINRETTGTSVNCEEVDAQAKTIEPREVITPAIELYSCNAIQDKHCDDRETSKNMNVNVLTSNRLAALEAAMRKSHNHDISDKTSKIQHLPPSDSAIIVEDCVEDDNDTEESLDKAKNIIGTREKLSINNGMTGIQATETRIEDTCSNEQDKKMKSIPVRCVDINDDEEPQTPMCRLTKYINNKKRIVRKRPIKKITYICKLADKFVKKQLEKLRDSLWEDSVYCDVMQKLKSTCGPRIIAKCIVEFLLENVNYMEDLDKSFTPPAPLMTTFEQKIIALLIDLDASKPKIIHFVQAAIEYNLFKLTNEVKVQVETLTRIYVILSRIKKDRERVRMMCCNALYCLGFKSINVLYTILTCWPEVLPNAETNKGILPKCIAFLIGSQCANEFNKLTALKSLISSFYKYSYNKETKKDMIKELMNALKAEKTNGLETAIILVAKREGPSWTYQNIIQSDLLPMIINHELPCVYSAFSLLGKLMRAFPLKDTDHVVQDISEQLRDLIQSGQGSEDQQEGIISALLSLSRHKFNIVAQCVINWTPNKSLRPATVTQLEAFINARNANFWKQYLQKKCVQSKK
ncbi:uncharacterized protein [Linepithema humile]